MRGAPDLSPRLEFVHTRLDFYRPGWTSTDPAGLLRTRLAFVQTELETRNLPLIWSRRRDSNPQPFIYETNALSRLSYSAKKFPRSKSKVSVAKQTLNFGPWTRLAVGVGIEPTSIPFQRIANPSQLSDPNESKVQSPRSKVQRPLVHADIGPLDVGVLDLRTNCKLGRRSRVQSSLFTPTLDFGRWKLDSGRRP